MSEGVTLCKSMAGDIHVYVIDIHNHFTTVSTACPHMLRVNALPYGNLHNAGVSPKVHGAQATGGAVKCLK